MRHLILVVLAFPIALFAQEGLEWAASVPMGFPEVMGIEINTLGESGELQLQAELEVEGEEGSACFETEYAFTHWFSVEGELLLNFESPYLPGAEVSSSFSILRNEMRGLLLIGGLELGIPFVEDGELEIEPNIGFIKTFPSFAVLSRFAAGIGLELGEEDTAAGAEEEELEIELSGGVGPYFPIKERFMLGIPVTFVVEDDEPIVNAGIELDILFAEELAILLHAQYPVASEVEKEFSISIGITKSFE